MKKVLNFLMVLLMVMGLGMASGMTAFQAEAAETSGETALAANQDGDKGADAKKAANSMHPVLHKASILLIFYLPDKADAKKFPLL